MGSNDDSVSFCAKFVRITTLNESLNEMLWDGWPSNAILVGTVSSYLVTMYFIGQNLQDVYAHEFDKFEV